MRSIFIDCPSFLADLYVEHLQTIVPELILTVDDVPEGDVVGHIGDAVGVINDHTDMSDEILAACPTLKVIVFMGTGASSYIDIDAATRHGIEIRTIKGYGDRSVAEHAVSLMFDCGRRTARMDRALRNHGSWKTLDGIEFSGKTLGVVGIGGIGKEMVRLGSALDMKVIAWNRSGVSPELPCTIADSLEALFATADVVSLHLALNNETTEIINQQLIGLMKPSAILINTARGAIIEEGSLVDALQRQAIRAAGLDVFSQEPIAEGHPLISLENVTLTPHAAFMTTEASTRLLTRALEHMRDALASFST